MADKLNTILQRLYHLELENQVMHKSMEPKSSVPAEADPLDTNETSFPALNLGSSAITPLLPKFYNKMTWFPLPISTLLTLITWPIPKLRMPHTRKEPPKCAPLLKTRYNEPSNSSILRLNWQSLAISSAKTLLLTTIWMILSTYCTWFQPIFHQNWSR